jgi:2-oxoglutarate ferredoxin oxidoreductase subunit gamma
VALGAIAKLFPAVSAKAIEEAVLARVPKGTEKLNKEALRAGMAAAAKVKTSLQSNSFVEMADEDT